MANRIFGRIDETRSGYYHPEFHAGKNNLIVGPKGPSFFRYKIFKSPVSDVSDASTVPVHGATVAYGGEGLVSSYADSNTQSVNRSGIAYLQGSTVMPASESFGVHLNAKIMVGANTYGSHEMTNLGGSFDRWDVYSSRFNIVPQQVGLTKANAELCFYEKGLKVYAGISPNEDTGLPYNFNGYTLAGGQYVNTLQENVSDNTSGANIYPSQIGYLFGARWDSPKKPGLNAVLQTGPDGGLTPGGPWTTTAKAEFSPVYILGDGRPASSQLAAMATVQVDPNNPTTTKQGLGVYWGQNVSMVQLGAGYAIQRLQTPDQQLTTKGFNAAINVGLPGDSAVWSAGYSRLVVEDVTENLLEPVTLTVLLPPGIALRAGVIVHLQPQKQDPLFAFVGMGFNHSQTWLAH